VMLGSEVIAARKAAKGAAPAYVYMVAWETPVAGGIFKTPHTMEIPFMLYSYDKVRAFVGPDPGARRMADQIGGAWVAFARTGKPDHPGIPHWPAFNTTERPVMVFDTQSRVVDDPLPGARQVLESLPPALMLRG
jgi:para-nitrobenzyl esterase